MSKVFAVPVLAAPGILNLLALDGIITGSEPSLLLGWLTFGAAVSWIALGVWRWGGPRTWRRRGAR